MRSTLDKLISATGLLVAVVLIGASGLMFWASSFIDGQVDQQLSEQRITMPTDEALEADDSLSDEDRRIMSQFAGSELDTAAEAKAYADNFIKPHLNHSTGGETYSTLGAKVAEAPRDAEAVLTATFDLDQLREERAAWGLFRDRRPDLYGRIGRL